MQKMVSTEGLIEALAPIIVLSVLMRLLLHSEGMGNLTIGINLRLIDRHKRVY